jgi:2-keto-4-pentenoate hydratase/2-oxohepta-3-ene-1,7-dioic acid hydratase in catechol pathway
MGRIDYEAELVVRICRLGKNIPQRFAYRYYDALTVGIDFTARDMQRQASAAGQPWTICKGFDGAAAVGEWVPKEKVLTNPETVCTESGLQRLQFRLDITRQTSAVNPYPSTVQEGRTSDMLYTVDEIISYVSHYFTLKTGDLLYTGTPAGVGPVSIGDHLEGYLAERKVLDFYCR